MTTNLASPNEPRNPSIVDARGPVPHGADRWALPGECCTCGLPALVIYRTGGYGDVGWCGRSNP